jgi:hypothetical protein
MPVLELLSILYNMISHTAYKHSVCDKGRSDEGMMETRTDASFQQTLTSLLCGAQKRVGINRETDMLGAVTNLQEHEIKSEEINYKGLEVIYNKAYKEIRE